MNLGFRRAGVGGHAGRSSPKMVLCSAVSARQLTPYPSVLRNLILGRSHRVNCSARLVGQQFLAVDHNVRTESCGRMTWVKAHRRHQVSTWANFPGKDVGDESTHGRAGRSAVVVEDDAFPRCGASGEKSGWCTYRGPPTDTIAGTTVQVDRPCQDGGTRAYTRAGIAEYIGGPPRWRSGSQAPCAPSPPRATRHRWGGGQNRTVNTRCGRQRLGGRDHAPASTQERI